jgi:enoyl-CoA hydratase/carnithine racemase
MISCPNPVLLLETQGAVRLMTLNRPARLNVINFVLGEGQSHDLAT